MEEKEKKRSTAVIREEIETLAMIMAQSKPRLDALMKLVDEHAEAYLEENWQDAVEADGSYIHEDNIGDYVAEHADEFRDESRD